jgi:hypothetical protein
MIILFSFDHHFSNLSSAVDHIIVRSRITIQNSMVVGSITPNDCGDSIDLSSVNIILSQIAMPTVSANSPTDPPNVRLGIVFPTISGFNNMPIRPWTGISDYPCRK